MKEMFTPGALKQGDDGDSFLVPAIRHSSASR